MQETHNHFIKLKYILKNWTDDEATSIPSSTGNYRRVYQLLQQLVEQEKISSWLDLGCLIRQALCVQTSREGIATLEIPSTSPWPSYQFWQNIGVTILSEQDGCFTIEAAEWSPTWLSGDTSQIFKEVYKGVTQRPDLSVPADISFQEATGFSNYSSPGQREAVRALFFMEPGSSLVVNLPTGSGKSLVGYIPSLTNPHPGHLTVFVVPTVALAMDQERQFRKIKKTDSPLAWHSGLPDEEKILIKNNIRSGIQPVIFTSPESVCGSLRMALYDASKNGFLRYLIIDEAHLVAQWGDEFRPDFQAIAGVRRMLLRACPNQRFRTVLMSATITEETLQTLETLFDLEDPPQIISSVHLRGEPHYWVSKCKEHDEKQSRIIELIKHGPRPFLLYVNEPKEAKYWHKTLSEIGFKRIDCFHGKTQTNSRHEIIAKWNEEKLDGIVATSAFGVGMDKSDVRMVIHACIPESLDRFYQEVGRGGRDGATSLSITLYDNIDYKKATGMVIPRIITENLGLSRWQTLINGAVKSDSNDELLLLDLSLVPPGINQQSDSNKAWNLLTVLLLTRAEIISLDAVPPPSINDDASDDQQLEVIEQYYNTIAIRILEPNHCDEQIWQKHVSQERESSIKRAKRNFELLKDAVFERREIGQVLCDLYRISRSRLRVTVTWRCASCFHCREQGQPPKVFAPPIVVPLDKTTGLVNPSWQDSFPMLDKAQPIVVFCDEFILKNNIKEFLTVLEAAIRFFGIYEIAVPANSDLTLHKRFHKLHTKTRDYFLVNTTIDTSVSSWINIPLPLISILLPWDNKVFPESLLFLTRPLHIIFAPRDIQDPDNSLRKFADIYANKITFKEMRTRLSNVDFE